MAISRNQLLLGGAIVGVLAILFFRNRAKKKDNLLNTAVTKNPIADDGMPSLATDDKPTPLPTATSPNDPKTGGLKIVQPDLPPKNQGINPIVDFETEEEKRKRLVREFELEQERLRLIREQQIKLSQQPILQDSSGNLFPTKTFDPLDGLMNVNTVSSTPKIDIFKGDTFGLAGETNLSMNTIY